MTSTIFLPRHMLCVPAFDFTEQNFKALIENDMQKHDIASIIFTGSTADPRAYAAAVKPLVAVAQHQNIAALVQGDTQMVGHTGADGLHIDIHGKSEEWIHDICDALKPEYIVGVGDIRSKHDVISAAEFDIDYVFFGNPNGANAKGNSIETLLEFTQWWAAIMELPCVCAIPSPEFEAQIIEAQPDFIAYFANTATE